MRFVAHAIGFKGFVYGFFDHLPRWYIRERKNMRRSLKPVEMSIKTKDTILIHSQPLPYCVSTLNRAIEYRNLGLFTRQQFTTDVYENIRVLWIVGLKHIYLSTAR